MMESIESTDPFADPSVNSSQREFGADNFTLEVGRNASLTLGTDSLIILGKLRQAETQPDMD